MSFKTGVVLRANFNGTDGDTTYIAETGQVGTFVGNAELDDAQKESGATSLLIPASNGMVTFPADNKFDFGSDNFYIKFNVRFSDKTGAHGLFGIFVDGSNYLGLSKNAADKLSFTFFVGGVSKASYIMTNAWSSLSDDTWYKIEVERDGSTFTIKIDDTAQTLTVNTAISDNSLSGLSGVFSIGSVGAGSGVYLDGWIDSFQIDKVVYDTYTQTANGIKFLGTDYNSYPYTNTVAVSSGDGTKEFAFDGIKSTRWMSSGQSTDEDFVYMTIDLLSAKTIDSVFLYNTNIANMTISYLDDAEWKDFVLTKSDDGYHVFGHISTPQVIQYIRVHATSTITANQEKYITLFYAFAEIGQLNYFPAPSPEFSPNQDIFHLDDGRAYIIEKGESFSVSLNFKSHINQDDITLVETLAERKIPFFIWMCGNRTSIFRYKFAPYRFKDIFKVGVVKPRNPQYTNNYYNAGLNMKLNLIEVI